MDIERLGFSYIEIKGANETMTFENGKLSYDKENDYELLFAKNRVERILQGKVDR